MRQFSLDGDETIDEFTSNAIDDVRDDLPREKRVDVLDKLIEVAECPKPERYVEYFTDLAELG